MIKKIDKFIYGVIGGLLLPLIVFLIIFIVNKDDIEKFGNLFVLVDLHISAFTIGVIPNLVLFYIFLQRNLNKLSRGILLITILYLILFLILFI